MKKNIILFIMISCLMCLLLSCNTTETNDDAGDDEPCINSISMIRLISNPENYHGKKVRIIGVGYIGDTHGAIHLSKEHLKYRIFENSLSISLVQNEFLNESHAEFNGRYVIVEGYFTMYREGTAGGLFNITRYNLWGGGINWEDWETDEEDEEAEALPSED